MEALVIIFSILFVCIMLIVRNKRDKEKIEEKVNSIGGKILYIEWSFFGKGPFKIAGKGTMVYKFQYTVKQNGEDVKKEAWVKTGGFFGDDWRF